jgi:cytidylate kinase
MERVINIAIDGHSACGKSTVAKMLAERLDFLYIDSGAMYRAVSLFALDNGLAQDKRVDAEGLVERLDEVDITFRRDGAEMDLLLNGVEIEPLIRNMRVSRVVSPVSTIPEVREKLVELQQAIGKEGGVIMDGRDIGTIVFPDADLKIFLTASIEVRAKRRWMELERRGTHLSMSEVLDNLQERDLIDSQRDVGPLVQAEDALLLDNSDMDVKQTLNRIAEEVEKVYSPS